MLDANTQAMPSRNVTSVQIQCHALPLYLRIVPIPAQSSTPRAVMFSVHVSQGMRVIQKPAASVCFLLRQRHASCLPQPIHLWKIKAANIVCLICSHSPCSCYEYSYCSRKTTPVITPARVPQHITRWPLTPVTSHHTLSPPLPAGDRDRDRGGPSKMGCPDFKAF